MKASFTAVILTNLIAIPVKAYATVGDSRDSLQGVHLEGGQTHELNELKFCHLCARVVNKADVRRLAYHEGAQVLLTEQELEGIKPQSETPRPMRIDTFVRSQEIHPHWWESSYVLRPDKGADYNYSAFLRALQETKMVGVGQIVAYGRHRLGMVYAGAMGIEWRGLSWAHQVHDLATELPEWRPAPVDAPTAKLYKQVLARLAEPDFAHAAFTDPYPDALAELILAKAVGQPLLPQAKVEVRATAPGARLADNLKKILTLVPKTKPAKGNKGRYGKSKRKKEAGTKGEQRR